MGVDVWTYHRASCTGCGWEGAFHLSVTAAVEEADLHSDAHEAVEPACALNEADLAIYLRWAVKEAEGLLGLPSDHPPES